MSKRRLLVVLALVVIAVIIGIIVVRALPNDDSVDAPARTAQSQPSSANNDTADKPEQNPNQNTTNKPSAESGSAESLAATGPADGLLVFISATVLGIAASEIWRIKKRVS